MMTLLTNFTLIITFVLMIATFVTARTYTQLAVAIVLYPLLVFFIYKVFPRKLWGHPSKTLATQVQSSVTLAGRLEDTKRENIGISDTDKRVFLKLIGGVGIFLFLISLFNKRVENLIPKNLPGIFPAANIASSKNDSTPNQPPDEYKISEIDSDVISFYGFINSSGAWYIMRADTDKGSFRYARGESKFPDNWTNRENLKYDYYYNVSVH